MSYNQLLATMTQTSSKEPVYDMKPTITVLVIEDRKEFRETISQLLNNVSDMTCPKVFEFCETAIEEIKANAKRAAAWTKPDVLLLDVEFPEGHMSGIDAISKLKALLPDTPIVMLTIHDDADTIYAAFEAGASGYLFKESSYDQIIEAVRQADQGGLMMPAAVAKKALAYFKKVRAKDNHYNLSLREKDVLQEMAEGFSQKEIAKRLYIEPTTVNTHIQNIYRKLHVRCAPAAVAKAIREGIID